MFQLSLNLPLAQASDSWMSSWLTPIWFIASGIAIGIVALMLVILLIRALSMISPWEQLSKTFVGHIVAGVITAGLTALVWFNLPETAQGAAGLKEPVLLGVALALLCGIVGWALVFCASKQCSQNAFVLLGEGAAGYLGVAAITFVLIGASVWGVGLLTAEPIVENPIQAFTSIPQVFATGKSEVVKQLDGAPVDGEAPFVAVPLDIDFDLLIRLELTSKQSVVLADAEDPVDFVRVPIRLGASEVIVWNDTMKKTEIPIPNGEGQQLYVQNREIDPAELTITAWTSPPVPEALGMVITAVCVLLIGLALLLQQAVAPRASAVAHATIKNELAQPLFLVLMLLGVVAILLYEFLSFNTFGEDIKLLKDCGITTIMLLAAFQGIWSASSSISEEIEGKTALTVLSKPIQRRSFVIGKFLGIFWVLMLMFVILGALELAAVAYKPLYDAREASKQLPMWQTCFVEMVRTVPGLAMAFMQSVVLMAISVALATRLPQLANLSVCFAIYVIGNLSTSLVSSTQDGFEIVKFVASLVATIVPILEHFSLQAAIDSGNPITMSLLSGNLIYCLLYVLLAMFLALLLFEDRDLA